MWWSALVLFVVAGGTGAFFRFGMVYGETGGLDLENIRHAHSHLMYFGWGTPALMVLIWRCLPSAVTVSRERMFWWVAGGTLGAAVLAYPFFLLFGYSPVQIGSAHLPIAVIGAGLNIFGWYGFVGLYLASTWELPRKGALRLWDVAVGALVLATMGAWGLALMKPLGLQDPFLATALTRVFLDLFSEGWFVLGGLGAVFAVVKPADEAPPPWSVWLVVIGLPFTFILGLPVSQLSLPMEVAGRVGGTVVATGLLVMGASLATSLSGERSAWLWGLPLAFLTGKAGAQFTGSLVPGLWLGASIGLRILYLHLMLLGFLSLSLLAVARVVWRRPSVGGTALFYGSVVVLLASLVPLTSWISGGGRAYEMAAWAALGPVVVATGLLVREGMRTRKRMVPEEEILRDPYGAYSTGRDGSTSGSFVGS